MLDMNQIQEKVNQIRKEYILWEDYDANEPNNFYLYLQSLEFANANDSSNIYKDEFTEILNNLNSKNLENWNLSTDSILANYCYFNPRNLEENFDLKDTKLHVIINFYTGNVISKDGVKDDHNQLIYRQYDTSFGNDIVQNDIQKNIIPEIEIVENYGLSKKIKIYFPEDVKDEVANISEVYYFDANLESPTNYKKCSELLDYEYNYKEKAAYFTINSDENYAFVIEDTNYLQYPKVNLEISLCNSPILVGKMKGIYWDKENNEVEISSKTDPNWYNYSKENFKMANAKTPDGNYWVWIPRFIYKELTDKIDLDFTYESTNVSTKNKTTTNYKLHPAFTEDNIKGFWVAKFQVNNDEDKISVLPAQKLSLLKTKQASKVCQEYLKNNNYSISSNIMSENEQDAILTLSKAYNIEIASNNSEYSGGSITERGFLNNESYSSSNNKYGIYDLIASEIEVTKNYKGDKAGRFRIILKFK